jgi:hypothetical protein
VSGGTTFLQAGEQRILTFKLPVGNLALDRAQILVIVQSDNFDPIAELLGPDGSPIAYSDDSSRDHRALLYTSASVLPGAPNLFLVVSAADGRGAGTFRVRVNINPQEQVGDEFVVTADELGDVTSLLPLDSSNTKQATLSRPFQFTTSKNEFLFFLPGDVHVGLAVKSSNSNANPDAPAPLDATQVSLIKFGPDGSASDVSVRVEVQDHGTILLAPKFDPATTFDLTRGEYILVLRAVEAPLPTDSFSVEFNGLDFDRTVGGAVNP